jgi:cytochrome P450
VVEYNPFAPEIQHNPYPCWKRLRDEAPVYYNAEFDFWALSRFDDVMAAALDPGTFISGNGVTFDGSDAGLPFLINIDDPEHGWYRKLLSRVFTPKRVAELEPFVREVATHYLDEARDIDGFDLVRDFSLRLPLDVIGELIGLPAEMRGPMHELAMRAGARDAVGPSAGRPGEDAIAAVIEMVATFHELVVDRRAHPRDDIITMLIDAEIVDDEGVTRRLTDEVIAAQFLLLANAGHETVTNLIGNGAVALWWYPDARAELVDDPRLIPGAVEEMLRWDSPAPLMGRWATREVELHGTVIPADSRVMLIMGSANHDERRYEDPDGFDIHRVMVRPLVFGFGLHLCLGASLARLETRVAFEELLARYPAYEVEASGVVRGPANMLRGVSNLPVVLSP